MKILLATSEAVPFAKTGGLADVASGLTKALSDLGHDVTLVLPHYPQLMPTPDALAQNEIAPIIDTGATIECGVGSKTTCARLLRTCFQNPMVDVILIDQPEYFDRPALYVEQGVPYQDNCERFCFFSRAIVETCRHLDLQPHVMHFNDWQTSLAPIVIAAGCRSEERFAQVGTVLTIHNLAFQGQFWRWDWGLTGLDWRYFTADYLEFYGDLNLLKGGIVFSDRINTVSPTYAREIQTPEFGCGLDGVLYHRRDRLSGILNGVDTTLWNPRTDPHLPTRYDIETLDGKAECKRALQLRCGLATRSGVPLFGMISRMTDQKGFDLIRDAAESLLHLDAQFVFLGSGEQRYQELVWSLARRAPEKMAATVGFDESLAHQIEAGVDAFLMPSRFEPCGLNQMYSLVYGTIPIVNPVGGLADSVISPEEAAASNGGERRQANGLKLSHYSPDALLDSIRRAIDLFHQGETWRAMQLAGMTSDWSWRRSALAYTELYEDAIADHVDVPGR